MDKLEEPAALVFIATLHRRAGDDTAHTRYSAQYLFAFVHHGRDLGIVLAVYVVDNHMLHQPPCLYRSEYGIRLTRRAPHLHPTLDIHMHGILNALEMPV